MNKSLSIQIDDRFGKWQVVGLAFQKKFGEGRSANYVRCYPCRCDCGTERPVRAFKLLANSRSCGCDKGRRGGELRMKHGHARRSNKRSRLYRIWSAVIERCTNPNRKGYARYGGRGISVCESWTQSFENFIAWAEANGYKDDLQIDRFPDNDGDYEPNNCRWATAAQNKRNTSKTRMITAFGETKCVTDWALDLRCRVTPSTIIRRIEKLGWTPEESITTPRTSRKNSPSYQGNIRQVD